MDVNADDIQCKKVLVVDQFHFVAVFNLFGMWLVNKK